MKLIFVTLVLMFYNSKYAQQIHLECKVDYMTRIVFEMDISKYVRVGNKYKFETGNNWRSGCPWTEEKDCKIVNNTIFRCTMNSFHMGLEKCTTYEFKLTIIPNIGNITLIKKFDFWKGLKATPWTTSLKILHCQGVIGVKYFVPYPLTDSDVEIDIFRYPTDIEYYSTQIEISIYDGANPNRRYNLTSKYLDDCALHTKDMCTVKEVNLKPCSTYKVCVSPSSEPCKEVRTNCPSLVFWRDVLLVVFGVVLSVLSIAYLNLRLKYKRARRKVYSFSEFRLVVKNSTTTNGDTGTNSVHNESISA